MSSRHFGFDPGFELVLEKEALRNLKMRTYLHRWFGTEVQRSPTTTYHLHSSEMGALHSLTMAMIGRLPSSDLEARRILLTVVCWWLRHSQH
jgi:hypothetical protein